MMVNDTDKSQAKTKKKLEFVDKICYASGIILAALAFYCIDMFSCFSYGNKKIDNLAQYSPIVRDYNFYKSLKYHLNYDYFSTPQPRFNRTKYTFNAIDSAFVDCDGGFIDSRFKDVYYSEFKSIIKNANYEAEKIFKSASEKLDTIALNKLAECDKKLEELASHPDIFQLNALEKRYYETFNPLWMFRK